MSMVAAAPAPVSAAAGAAPVILAENVAVDYPGRGRTRGIRVLQGIDLAIARGEFVSLIGPSGCGKSTLLKVLSGLLPPSEGRVQVAGLRPAEAARQRRIGLVFQEPTLLPWKTALDNVAFLLSIADRGLRRSELRERAHEMLRLVGLDHAAERLPGQLSGGMKQRVAIARALALDPEVLMMDEPFGALDAITREEMSDFVLDLWQRTGKTAILVTHAIDEAVLLSTRVHVMAANPARIVEILPITLPRPRTEASYADPAFTRAAARLRASLRHGRPGDAA